MTTAKPIKNTLAHNIRILKQIEEEYGTSLVPYYRKYYRIKKLIERRNNAKREHPSKEASMPKLWK